MAQSAKFADDGEQELHAMSEVYKALRPLTADIQKRVLDWAYSRCLGDGHVNAATHFSPNSISNTDSFKATSKPTFEDLVDLYDAVRPSTAAEKVLVAAYWFKTVGGQETFTSQPLNSALKDLGHGVSHMPSALSALEDQQPALVRQTQKSGKSQQARKTYKITDAGIKSIEGMIKSTTYNTASIMPTANVSGIARVSAIEATTNSIAIKLGCKDATDLIKAAALHITLVKSKERFSRQELLEEMKSSSYFKETYRANLSYYIKALLKTGFLNEPKKDIYVIVPGQLKELEMKLV